MLRHNLYTDVNKLVSGVTSIKITPMGYSHTTENEMAITTLGTVLKVLGYKEKTTFDFHFNQHEIVVNGRCNILHILHILLLNQDSFTIHEHNQVLNRLIKMLIATIGAPTTGDGAISEDEQKKLHPVICAYLDSAYKNMKPEPFIIEALKANTGPLVVEEYDGNILKHPLFQTFSIMMDYEETRTSKYNQKGIFGQVFGAGKHVKEYNTYAATFNKFNFYIPAAYLTKRMYGDVVVDADKIRASKTMPAQVARIAQSAVPKH